MKLIAPEYYTKFHCIADKCRHSCCVGWEIAIDPDKLVYYRSIEGEFGARLQKGIAEADDAAQFILDDEERCPFLNRTGLCDMITALGAVLVGGLFEGTLGLLAKYWRKLIAPVVAASVVIAIGMSLFSVGARSFGGGYAEDFGSAQNLLLGTITLVVCLGWNCFAKGYLKQLSVLVGLLVGYVVAILMGKVDLSVIFAGGFVSLPKLMPYKPEFHAGAILSVCIIFLVSAAETIGDTTAMVATGLNREIESKEISGSLACDGYASSLSSLVGCPPVTSFSQNVGLLAMTKVVNKFTIMTGAGCMILAGLLPPVGNFFASLPESVLGGCTIMMFGTIMTSGMQMLAKAGFNQRNVTIAALSLAVGVGFTAASEIDLWHIFPEIVQSVFSANVVAVAFVVSIILNLVLPKNMDVDKISE